MLLCLGTLWMPAKMEGAYWYGPVIDPRLGVLDFHGAWAYHPDTNSWLYLWYWDANEGYGWAWDYYWGWVYAGLYWSPWFYSTEQGVMFALVGGRYPYRWFWVPGHGYVLG